MLYSIWNSNLVECGDLEWSIIVVNMFSLVQKGYFPVFEKKRQQLGFRIYGQKFKNDPKYPRFEPWNNTRFIDGLVSLTAQPK